MAKLRKFQTLYVHEPPKFQSYQCRVCPMWIRGSEQCTIHKPTEKIRAHGACGYWVPGTPLESGESHGTFSRSDTGYDENAAGFACKRCAAFIPGQEACRVVSSEGGLDPGKIHPDACCAAWLKDPERGDMGLVKPPGRKVPKNLKGVG